VLRDCGQKRQPEKSEQNAIFPHLGFSFLWGGEISGAAGRFGGVREFLN
jgi:hypothetical protein